MDSSVKSAGKFSAQIDNVRSSSGGGDGGSDSSGSLYNAIFCIDNNESNLTQNQELRNKWNLNEQEEYDGFSNKKPKHEQPLGFFVPPLFLAPLRMIRPSDQESMSAEKVGDDSIMEEVAVNHDVDQNNNNGDYRNKKNQLVLPVVRGCKQFWKAGDYEERNGTDSTPPGVYMDHVRVHPKFLHSNATSHKWALGAFAELLDNALDEAVRGATYVNVDVLENEKDGYPMILVEDNGGGMNPEKMRQCMSFGYSAKSKMANTIGQYGNGFKTSTMRLGADVIVLSRCKGHDGISQTQSIGLLSYTFLRATGREDIVVPMIDFEKREQGWEKMVHSSLNDWEMKLSTILQWSPFFTEKDLLQQFNFLKDQGTRIIIYNLWEDDENKLELDFDTDPRDIQLRGVNRDEKNIQMAKEYLYSRHFLTYKHSLRSYASILYLKLPTSFRIILRGKDVEHHNLVNDMMLTKPITYKPQHLQKEVSDNEARGMLGFVKDAHHHIDIQGFNIYHKNRLIKPFWRVWNAAGSDGRGVIGLLEANFVEPAHDKQGFERTTVLSRLEAKLIDLQKTYWSTNCQEIGYAARRNLKKRSLKNTSSSNKEGSSHAKDNFFSRSVQNEQGNTTRDKRSPQDDAMHGNARYSTADTGMTSWSKVGESTPANDGHGKMSNLFHHSGKSFHDSAANQRSQGDALAHSKVIKKQQFTNDDCVEDLYSSKELDDYSTDREKRTGGAKIDSLLKDLEREREKNQKLESQLSEKIKELDEAKKFADQLDKDHLIIIDVLQDERQKWTETENHWMQKLRIASETIEELRERVKQLESRLVIRSCKAEKD